MVCIQCYLPPILFMIYMKFIQPLLAPFIQPLINRLIVYFRGPEALRAADSGCPIRPKAKKTQQHSEGTADETQVSDGSKAKDQ